MLQWISDLYSYLFGSSDPRAPQNSIESLRNVEAGLLKKQEFLEKSIETEAATARSLATTNKRAAIQALRKKKQFEKDLIQNDGVLTNIQSQIDSLQTAMTNADLIDTMGKVKNALTEVHKVQDAENVHDLIDDIDEQQALAGEISDAISGPSYNNVVDQSELDAELAGLQEEVQSAEMAAIKPLPVHDNLVQPQVDYRTPEKIATNNQKQLTTA